MAINVNTVYKTVLLILNKEERGYVTPDEFNKIAAQVQLETFEQYGEDLNQQLRVPQTDTDYSDRVAAIDEHLSIFKTSGPSSYVIKNGTVPSHFTLPTSDIYGNTVELYRIGAVSYKEQVELQRLQRMDFYNIQKSPLTKSTLSFPTYLLESDRIFAKPDTITSDISVDFLRKPIDPRWGYSIGTVGQYVYDSTVYGALLLNTGAGTLTNSISTNPTDKNQETTIGVIQSGTTGIGVGLTASIITTGTAGSATVTNISVTSAGSGYVSGDNVTFAGLSFGGSTGTLEVGTVLSGPISAVTGAVAGTYPGISLTGGNGTGATANIVMANATTVTSITMDAQGTGYKVGDILTTSGSIGGTAQFTITLIASDITSSDLVLTLQDSNFNSDSTYGSTQIELDVSEQTTFILRTLFYFGVVVKDPQIIQIAASQIQQEESNKKR